MFPLWLFSSSSVLCRVDLLPGEREIHRADRQLFLYLVRPSQSPGRDRNDPRWVTMRSLRVQSYGNKHVSLFHEPQFPTDISTSSNISGCNYSVWDQLHSFVFKVIFFTSLGNVWFPTPPKKHVLSLFSHFICSIIT